MFDLSVVDLNHSTLNTFFDVHKVSRSAINGNKWHVFFMYVDKFLIDFFLTS